MNLVGQSGWFSPVEAWQSPNPSSFCLSRKPRARRCTHTTASLHRDPPALFAIFSLSISGIQEFCCWSRFTVYDALVVTRPLPHHHHRRHFSVRSIRSGFTARLTCSEMGRFLLVSAVHPVHSLTFKTIGLQFVSLCGISFDESFEFSSPFSCTQNFFKWRKRGIGFVAWFKSAAVWFIWLVQWMYTSFHGSLSAYLKVFLSSSDL